MNTVGQTEILDDNMIRIYQEHIRMLSRATFQIRDYVPNIRPEKLKEVITCYEKILGALLDTE